MTKQKMWSLLALSLVLAMVVAACGATATPEPTEAPPEPTATQMAEPTEAPAEETPEGEMIGCTVSVLAVWGGDELDNFRAMIAPFEEQTGITVEYEGTRDLNAVLTTRLEGGNPPDLAGLPGPGQLQEFAQAGHLVALNDVLDMEQMQSEYDEGFLNLASIDDNLYGIFIKAAVKSLVWYNPKAFDAAGYEIPTTWDEMNALEDQIIADGSTPWCIGLESGAASGWPGTDWIEDIMLRTAGPHIYDQWWNHEIPWTDPAVKNAWETWGTVVTDPEMIYGGTPFVLSTNFGEAPFPMFDDPPGCYLHRQASFITSFITEQFTDMLAGED